MPRKREDLDPVRLFIVELVARHNTTLAAVSRRIGRNHAYLHQFIHRGTPRRLPEDMRLAIAEILRVDERKLIHPDSHRIRGFRQNANPSGVGGHPVTTKPSSFAARLSIARAESEFETPSAFAYAAAIDRSRYADLEDGKEEPTLGELNRIYRVSKKPLDWLIGGADDAKPDGIGTAKPSGATGALERSDIDKVLAPDIDLDDHEPSQPSARKRH